MTMQIG